MALTSDQTADHGLSIPSTSFVPDDLQDGSLPSQYYAPDELGDLSLFPGYLGTSQSQEIVPWNIEDLGYTYNTPHVYPDGRMEGGLQAPKYYAYSPRRIDTWEEGSQAIDDFDWSVPEENDINVSATQPLVAHPFTTTPDLSISTSFWNNPPEAGLGLHLHDQFQIHEKLEATTLDSLEQTPAVDIASPPWVSSPTRTEDAITIPPKTRGSILENAEIATRWPDDTTMTDADASFDLERGTINPTAELTALNTLSLRKIVLQDMSLSRAIDPQVDVDHDEAITYMELERRPASYELKTKPSQSVLNSNENTEKTSPVLSNPSQYHPEPIYVSQPSPLAQSSGLLPLLTTQDPAQPSVTRPELEGELDHQQCKFQLQDATAEETSDGHCELLPPENVSTESREVIVSKGQLEESQVHANEPDVSINLPDVLSQEEGPLNDDGFSSDSQDITLVGAEAAGPSRTPRSDRDVDCRTDLSSNIERILMGPEHKRGQNIPVENPNRGERDTQDKEPSLQPATRQVLLVPSTVDRNFAAEEHPTTETARSIPVGDDLLKRTEPVKTEKSSDNETEESSSTASDAKAKRHKTTIFSNKASKDIGDGVDISPATEQLEELTAPPQTKKRHSKAAKTYFEEDTRPADDGSLPHLYYEDEDKDIKLPTNDLDSVVQKHYSNAREHSSTHLTERLHTPQRTTKNGVSNRELVALGSTLAPVDKEIPEPEVVTKKKRTAPATSKKTPASKKAKIEPKKPSAALSIKRERRTKEATYEIDEETQEPSPIPIIEAPKKSTIPATPATKKVTAQKSTCAKKVTETENQSLPTEHLVHHGKRHTRSDTKLDDSTSTGQHDDEPSSKKPKTWRLSDVSKISRPSTPTPSIASTGTSPARNKYGFSPKPLRSRKTPVAAAKPKGSVRGKAGAGTGAAKKDKAKAKDEVDDGTPLSATTTRMTRRASAIEIEAKETNIGKRLRSKD